MAARIKCGDFQLHEFPKGFAVTEIRQFTTERTLFVLWLRGHDFDEWKAALVEKLNALAKQYECAGIEAACRFGLEKSLSDLGFRRSQIIIRKEVL